MFSLWKSHKTRIAPGFQNNAERTLPMKKRMLLLPVLLAGMTAGAAGLYVAVDTGDDGAAGTKVSPWRNISTAIKRARPGDTIFVLPAGRPIVQSVSFRGVFGTPEKPIVFDGMNNIFLGVKPLHSGEWTPVSPGLFKRTRKDGINMINRYFMVVDGKRQRMGRFNKFPKGQAPWKSPEELKPGEWTIIDTDPQNRGQHLFDQYVRLDDKATAADLVRWSEPFRCDGGVQFSGKNGCITIRNVIAKHFWNDGFNIHHDARQITFENIAAVECGDDGISGHEGVELIIRNYVGIGNSTGICHALVNATHENAYIEGTLGRDLYLPKDGGMQSFKNVCVNGDSRGGISIVPSNGKARFDRLVCINREPKADFLFHPKNDAEVTFSDCRISGYKNVPKLPGLSADCAVPEKEMAEFKAKLFALFGGQLEKALEK